MSTPSRPSRTPHPAAGPAAIVAAALIWGTNGLAASLLPAGSPAPAVAAARLLAGGVLLLALGRPGRVWAVLGHRATRRPLAVAAVAMAVYQASYFAALDRAGVAVGSVVAMAAVPVFAGLIAAVRGRGGTSRTWLAATSLAVAGGVLLGLGRPDGRPLPAGVLCALLAGASYAIFTTACAAAIRRGADSGTSMAAVFLLAGLLLAPVLVAAPTGWLFTGRGAGVIGYLAAVSTVGAYLLYGRGLRTVGVATASTLTLAEGACATVIGVLVLHEPLTTRSLTGLLLLVAALLLLTMRLRRPIRVAAVPAQRATPTHQPSNRRRGRLAGQAPHRRRTSRPRVNSRR